MSVQPAPVVSRQLQGITPVFIVSDIMRTAEYYRDVLGFSFDHYWGDPPSFVLLRRDGVDLFMSSATNPGIARPNHKNTTSAPWDAYIWVQDVTTLLNELRRRGARLVSGPDVTFYRTIEFVVEDPDGHRLCFAQDTLDE
jgi:catechol 2,3-dioxygenase-like lactoylglutathione lyase family enzyme